MSTLYFLNFVAHPLYLEEMHSGKLMLSYLDELLSVPRTKEELGKFYGGRIWFGEADLAGLITDEYISRMKIDNEEFDFTQDLAYGLIAISPIPTTIMADVYLIKVFCI